MFYSMCLYVENELILKEKEIASAAMTQTNPIGHWRCSLYPRMTNAPELYSIITVDIDGIAAAEIHRFDLEADPRPDRSL